MKSLLGLVQSAPCRIDVEFKDAQALPYKKLTTIKTKKDDTEEVPVYSNKDSIHGEVRITPLTTKKLEHQGIKVQLLGVIELASERGSSHEFVSLVRELAPPGDFSTSKVFPFEFKNVELQYDSYKGQQVRCRYLLRVSVTSKGMAPDSKRDFNIWVVNYEQCEAAADPIKMEVGIEECLHIEFQYDRARYHLQDVVVGRIFFLLVRIKLKHMEVEIRRKETTGAGTSAHSESETIAKYEIMDGAPVRGESVPIRLYLSPYDLAPTYRDIHNKFSVRYYLNLVLVDEEDRRYFKQQEITLYRKAPSPPGAPKPAATGPPKLVTYTTLAHTARTASGAVSSTPAASNGGAFPAAAAAPTSQAAAAVAAQPAATASGSVSPTPDATAQDAVANGQQATADVSTALPVSTSAPTAAPAAAPAFASPALQADDAGEQESDVAAVSNAAATASHVLENSPAEEDGLVFGDGDNKAPGIL